jgi:hypothetical protein
MPTCGQPRTCRVPIYQSHTQMALSRKKKNQSLGALFFSPPSLPKKTVRPDRLIPFSSNDAQIRFPSRSIPTNAAAARFWSPLLSPLRGTYDCSYVLPSSMIPRKSLPVPFSLIPHRFYCSNRSATSTS